MYQKLRASMPRTSFCPSDAIRLGLLCFAVLWCVSDGCPRYVDEWASVEIAFIGLYKDLICPVKDPTCKVSWKKDGIPLLSEGAGHATRCNGRELYFPEVAQEDAGNYTCHPAECSDGRSAPSQWLELRVLSHSDSVSPFSKAYSQCRDREAVIGDNVTFCCVFYVGDTASSDQYTYWLKGIPWHPIPEDSIAEGNVKYDNRTDLRTCVTVAVTEEGDFTNYTVTCSTLISNTWVTLYLRRFDQSWPEWVKAAISGILAVASFTFLAAAVYLTNSIEIRLVIKDKFGKPEQGDGKDYDTFISYYWSNEETGDNPDRRYALDLAHRLTKRGYSVYLCERDSVPGTDTAEEISRSLEKSRRYIMLLSPEFVRHMRYETEQCLDIVRQNKRQIIPLFLRKVPQDELHEHTVLEHIVSTHPHLKWQVLEARGRPSSSQCDRTEPGSEAARSTVVHTPTMEDPTITNIYMNGIAVSSFDGRTSRTSVRPLSRAESQVWKTILLRMPPRPRRQLSTTASGSDQGVSEGEMDGLLQNSEEGCSPPEVPS